MCMGADAPPPPPPPAPPPAATKALTTPEQASSDSVEGQRSAGSSRGGLRVDIGGGSSGSGLNIPTN